MIESKSKELGERGYVYTVAKLGSLAGLQTLAKLGKLLGKPLGEAVQQGALNTQAIGGVVSALAESISGDDLQGLCDVFMPRTTVSGGNHQSARQFADKKVPLDRGFFDLHFSGEYAELFAWLAFCLEVNFGGFLGVLGTIQKGMGPDLQGLTTPQPLASPSQNTSKSAGPSGASPVANVSATA